MAAENQSLEQAVAALNSTSQIESLQGWSADLVQFLTISTFAFIGFVLLLCTILLWRTRANGMQVLRIFGVITIIGLSSLLLFVGYSNAQLTPIVGLFGAIAGYLLGKDSGKIEERNGGEA